MDVELKKSVRDLKGRGPTKSVGERPGGKGEKTDFDKTAYVARRVALLDHTTEGLDLPLDAGLHIPSSWRGDRKGR